MQLPQPSSSRFEQFRRFRSWGSSEKASRPKDERHEVSESDWGEVETPTPCPKTARDEKA